MAASIFWYDFETTGTDAAADRILQVAGIRTDEQLNPVGEPLNLYCRLTDDVLPHPRASLVTGIGPQVLQEEGLMEAHFVARLQQEMMQPQTCTAGYNSLRFDDEFTRYALYRNFHDPYAREWQGGNSRWDILDALRTAWALEPEGIEWPEAGEGRVSFRLELLTAANGIEHDQAHDALSDVRATIGMARLLRKAQPALYEHLYRLRDKHAVHAALRIGRPVVHVSGRLSPQRRYLGVMLPLLQDDVNRNAYVACNLLEDTSPLLELPADEIRRRLYTRRDELQEGELPIPLKKIHANKCPALVAPGILADRERPWLEVDDRLWRVRGRQLLDHLPEVQQKLREVFAADGFPGKTDPEQQLYAGFLSRRDRDICNRVLEADAQQLARDTWPFDDPRLPELLFRYRARNFPDSLMPEERESWREFCRWRLQDASAAAPRTLADFWLACGELDESERNSEVIRQWQAHANMLARKYGLEQ